MSDANAVPSRPTSAAYPRETGWYYAKLNSITKETKMECVYVHEWRGVGGEKEFTVFSARFKSVKEIRFWTWFGRVPMPPEI